jgi:hypothetical protein
MPIMKDFYVPLKKAVGRIQRDNAGWADKYKKEVCAHKSVFIFMYVLECVCI